MREQLTSWVGKVFARIELNREEGQALVEYGLILALVAVACLVALQTLGTNVAGILNQIATAIAGA